MEKREWQCVCISTAADSDCQCRFSVHSSTSHCMTIEHITRYFLCMCPMLYHGARIRALAQNCVPASLEATPSQSPSGICTDAHLSVEHVLPYFRWAPLVIPQSCNCSPCPTSPGHAVHQEQIAAHFHTNSLATCGVYHTAPVWCLLAFSAENFAMPHAISSLCHAL